MRIAIAAATVTMSLTGPIHGVTSTLAVGMTEKSGIEMATTTYGTRTHAVTRTMNATTAKTAPTPIFAPEWVDASAKSGDEETAGEQAGEVASLDPVPPRAHRPWSYPE